MSIIDRIPASVQTDPGIHGDTLDHAEPFEPSQADLDDYGRWLAGRSDLTHFDGPVPLEALVEPCDSEDLEADGLPWWASLPESPELDTPVELGPVAMPVKVRNVRGERFYLDTAGDPDRAEDGYVVRDRQLHNAAIRRFRWAVDARRFADELNACEPRSRPSWNPEADAIGRS